MFHKALPHLCRCIKKEETTKIPASDSSIESEPVIVVENPSPVKQEETTEIYPVDSSMCTISLGSGTKRTPSPELEVAMALTAMDDRSSNGDSAKTETPTTGKPLPAGESGSPLKEEIQASSVSKPTIAPVIPPLPALKPNVAAVNKRTI